jgi:hypothetical protein
VTWSAASLNSTWLVVLIKSVHTGLLLTRNDHCPHQQRYQPNP